MFEFRLRIHDIQSNDTWCLEAKDSNTPNVSTTRHQGEHSSFNAHFDLIWIVWCVVGKYIGILVSIKLNIQNVLEGEFRIRMIGAMFSWQFDKTSFVASQCPWLAWLNPFCSFGLCSFCTLTPPCSFIFWFEQCRWCSNAGKQLVDFECVECQTIQKEWCYICATNEKFTFLLRERERVCVWFLLKQRQYCGDTIEEPPPLQNIISRHIISAVSHTTLLCNPNIPLIKTAMWLIATQRSDRGEAF